MFDLAIAVGALLGGTVVDHVDLPAVFFVGAALVATAALVVGHRHARDALAATTRT